MRRRQGSTAGPALPACRGEGRPRRPRHPSQRGRGPPRKLSCTCRSPRPGSRERRRTPTLSAMEPVAGSTALLAPAPPGVTQAPTRPAGSAARYPPRRPTGLAAPAEGHGGAAPAAPPPSALGQPGWLWAGDGPCGATGRSPRRGHGPGRQRGALGLRRCLLCARHRPDPDGTVPWRPAAAQTRRPAGAGEHSHGRSPSQDWEGKEKRKSPSETRFRAGRARCPGGGRSSQRMLA